MIGISGCLLGKKCRYDGGHQEQPALLTLLENTAWLSICPEVEGGLPIPRDPGEIKGGDGFNVWQGQAKVISAQGKNLTEAYQLGAKKAYKRLKQANIHLLILKENSPSCGSHYIYDGSFSGYKKTGVGVATAYFIQQGLTVFSENEIEEIAKWLANHPEENTDFIERNVD